MTNGWNRTVESSGTIRWLGSCSDHIVLMFQAGLDAELHSDGRGWRARICALGAAPDHARVSAATFCARCPILALLSLSLPHRQAMPSPLLVEVLQHRSHPTLCRPHRHARLLWRSVLVFFTYSLFGFCCVLLQTLNSIFNTAYNGASL